MGVGQTVRERGRFGLRRENPDMCVLPYPNPSTAPPTGDLRYRKAGRETPAPSSRTGCFRHESSCANFLADGPLAAAQRPNLVKTMDTPVPAPHSRGGIPGRPSGSPGVSQCAGCRLMESLKLMVAANRHFRSAGSGTHSLRGAPDPADSLHQCVRTRCRQTRAPPGPNPAAACPSRSGEPATHIFLRWVRNTPES